MSLVNVNASHNSGFGFTSTVDPKSVNPAALSAPTSNIQAAAASKIVGGGRINRKKINKISGKYKMRGSKKSKRRSIRRMHYTCINIIIGGKPPHPLGVPPAASQAPPTKPKFYRYMYPKGGSGGGTPNYLSIKTALAIFFMILFSLSTNDSLPPMLWLMICK